MDLAEEKKIRKDLNSFGWHLQSSVGKLRLASRRLRFPLINQLIDYERGNKVMPIAAIPAPNSAIAVHAEPF